MHTITLANGKGGVGKTTIATILAYRYLKQGCSVAIVDADPSASLTSWKNMCTNWPRDLPVFSAARHKDITGAIRAARDMGPDYVIIDTHPYGPPELAPISALAAADVIVTPLGASTMDLNQLSIIGTMQEVNRRLDRTIPVMFILNMVDARTKIAPRGIADALRNISHETVPTYLGGRVPMRNPLRQMFPRRPVGNELPESITNALDILLPMPVLV